MMKMIMTSLTCLTISLILMNICSTISKKSTQDREKMSPFECGFDPQSSPRIPFSIHFFLIALLFLIFDIEIIIILPLIITLKTSIMTQWMMTLIIFITIITLGLYHEWKNGILQWTN